VPKIARLSLVFLLASGCAGGQGRAPILSPDGTMTLHTRIEQSRNDPVTYLCVVFEIRDSSGRILHTENTRASDAMRWTMAWVADDRIRLRSSDIGTFEWKRQADGSWVKEQAANPSVGGHAGHRFPALGPWAYSIPRSHPSGLDTTSGPPLTG
jgi:hypothetical protein